jgi:L-threonylcarbamoyladenylate synthase
MPADRKNIISIDENPDNAIALAAELYRSGRIFIYPTDTIYGIGGNPFDENVAKRIAAVKGRDEKKQFIWLISDFENLMNYVDIVYENHLDFLQKIWPGQLSVILNLNDRTKKIIKQNTISVRIPGNDFCLKLLKEITQPLISTSVNRSSEMPLTEIKNIIENFSEDVDAVFYSSAQAPGLSSTILDLTSEQPKLVREGSINFVELLKYFS